MTQVLLVSTDDRHTTAVAAVVAELEGFSRLLAVHSALQGRVHRQEPGEALQLGDDGGDRRRVPVVGGDEKYLRHRRPPPFPVPW